MQTTPTLTSKTNWLTPLLLVADESTAAYTDYIAMTPDPLGSYFQSCEAFCVSFCCGMNAFDVSPAQGAWWIREAGTERASQAKALLSQLIEDCASVQGKISFSEISVTLPAGEFVAWLRQWREALNYIEVRPGDLLKIAD